MEFKIIFSSFFIILSLIIVFLLKEIYMYVLVSSKLNKGFLLLKKHKDDFIIKKYNSFAKEHLNYFSSLSHIKQQGVFSLLNTPDTVKTFNFQSFSDKLTVSKLTKLPCYVDEIKVTNFLDNKSIYLKFEINYLSKLLPKYSILTLENCSLDKLNFNKSVQTKQLNSVANIIGGLSHNLNTSILSISSSSISLEHLVSEYKESLTNKLVTRKDHLEIANEMNDWIKELHNSAAYISNVVNSLKSQLVVMTQENTKTFTIKEFIQKIDFLFNFEFSFYQCMVEKNVRTNQSLSLDYEIECLYSVVKNIIQNSIESYKLQEEKRIIISIYNSLDNHSVIIEIEDNGCGIPKHIQQNIFHKMITSKGYYGKGLSLYLSKSAIESKYNGSLWFNSSENMGTNFYISIPICNINQDQVENLNEYTENTSSQYIS